MKNESPVMKLYMKNHKVCVFTRQIDSLHLYQTEESIKCTIFGIFKDRKCFLIYRSVQKK